MTFSNLSLSRVTKAIEMVLVVLTISVALDSAITQNVSASPRKAVELESFTASDLSMSILKDNYDIWAEEITKRNAVDMAGRLSAIDMELSNVINTERQLNDQAKAQLLDLAYNGPKDESALRAAIFLAPRVSAAEKKELLKRALVVAQFVEPGTARTLELAAYYTATLISLGDLAEAGRMRNKLFEMSQSVKVSATRAACFAKIVVGDIRFQIREFSEAADNYESAQSCLLRINDDSALQSFHLNLRIAWTAFRLLRYQVVLQHLEKVSRADTIDKISRNSQLSNDLGAMLAVSLSEVGGSLPASHWLQTAGRYDWVASGLSRSIKFLSQRENSRDAVKWSDAIEQNVMHSTAADEFYQAAIAAAEQEGLVERQIEFKSRAVLALQVNSNYARSLQLKGELDARRQRMVVSWSKDVIAYRAGQMPGSLGRALVLQFYNVVEALLAENIDVCSESESLRAAHRVFSHAKYVSLSEKIFQTFKGCALPAAKSNEIAAVRLEMLQTAWKENARNSRQWSEFFDALNLALASSPVTPEFRRIGFETISDAIEYDRLVDSESLLQKLYASRSNDVESLQSERIAFITAMVKLLSLQPGNESLRSLAWLMLGDVSASLATSESSRRSLEAGLVASALYQSQLKKSKGDVAGAADILASSAEKIGSESEFGRDLAFASARASCSAGLVEQCLTTSNKISENVNFSDHDRFLAFRWRGGFFLLQGRFLAAADAWTRSSEFALSSERSDLAILSEQSLIKAGNIFAELKMWQETMKVRTLLTRVSDYKDKSELAHKAILNWSIAALVNEAYDRAEELSVGLSDFYRKRGVKNSIKQSAEKRFVELVEMYANVRARSGSGTMIQSMLFEFLSFRNSETLIGSLKGLFPNHPEKLLISMHSYWKNDLLNESDRFAQAKSLAEVLPAAARLRKNYSILMVGCQTTERFKFLSSSIDISCVRKTSDSFVLLNEKLKQSLSSYSTADSSKYRAAFSELQNLDSFFRSRVSVAPHSPLQKSAGGFSIFEKRYPLFPEVSGVQR
jgi:hypothetical protein